MMQKNNNSLKRAAVLALFSITMALLPKETHGLYFYMERDSSKCFKDELVKNSVRK